MQSRLLRNDWKHQRHRQECRILPVSNLCQKGRPAVNVTTHGDKAITCVKCNQSHNLHQCAEFLAPSVRERKTFVKGNKLCFNCLKNNHQVGNCKSSHVCKECKGNYHSLLHINSIQFN
jgi:hypothetical protein